MGPEPVGYRPPSLRIVFFGTYDGRRHPRIRVLSEGFADLGDEVIECNVPMGLDTATRVRVLRRPWLLPVVFARLALTWPRLWLRARRLGRPDAVVVGYLGQLDVHLARRIWRRCCVVVLDHLVPVGEAARDRGSTSGRTLSFLDRIDRAAERAADVVCVDTDEHRHAIGAPSRERAVVVPVGAGRAWFREPERQSRTRTRVVFFGLYTPLQGAPTIGEAIRLLRDEPVEFTMIGSGQDYGETRAAAADGASAEWRDWVDSTELPSLVSEHDVCLGIFGTGPKAHRVVPNKVFQGAAAGAAIVTSDTAPQRRALGDAAVLVPPGDSGALAEALAALAADSDALWARRRSAYQRATETFRPDQVVAPLRHRLSLLPAHSR